MLKVWILRPKTSRMVPTTENLQNVIADCSEGQKPAECSYRPSSEGRKPAECCYRPSSEGQKPAECCYRPSAEGHIPAECSGGRLEVHAESSGSFRSAKLQLRVLRNSIRLWIKRTALIVYVLFQCWFMFVFFTNAPSQHFSMHALTSNLRFTKC